MCHPIPTLERIRDEALRLSVTERADLAQALVSSLDGAAESNVEDAWDAEIRRRLEQIDAGTAELVDREEFRRRIQARMGLI